ncbi:hypothetical protein Nans01_04280 [Nocardiopsis ansamitocini]|uniref:Uncharacterized protein n=1 Tax=Nocardiopsis ansamitocini TaxID=1670832 RepID=A0A9W6P2U6_9ACTN|nr:hypothetical protein Nans01_04280 [Nocardiopsis ansamitocini]
MRPTFAHEGGGHNTRPAESARDPPPPPNQEDKGRKTSLLRAYLAFSGLGYRSDSRSNGYRAAGVA